MTSASMLLVLLGASISGDCIDVYGRPIIQQTEALIEQLVPAVMPLWFDSSAHAGMGSSHI